MLKLYWSAIDKRRRHFFDPTGGRTTRLPGAWLFLFLPDPERIQTFMDHLGYTGICILTATIVVTFIRRAAAVLRVTRTFFCWLEFWCRALAGLHRQVESGPVPLQDHELDASF